MKNGRSVIEPPFRLRQDRADRPRVSVLEAWPTGQGDYFLAGRDTYPIRQRISAVGGRFDGVTRKWYVTRQQAEQLHAVVLVRVVRAPACCERRIDPELGCEGLATEAEVQAGRMTVRSCPHCGSAIRESVAIRDLLDFEGLPELGGPHPSVPTPEVIDHSTTPPWD